MHIQDYYEWLILWNKLKKKSLQQNREHRTLMLASEMAGVSKAVAYGNVYGKLGYQGELKKALADSLAMIYMLALNEGFDIRQISRLAKNELEHAINKRLG